MKMKLLSFMIIFVNYISVTSDQKCAIQRGTSSYPLICIAQRRVLFAEIRTGDLYLAIGMHAYQFATPNPWIATSHSCLAFPPSKTADNTPHPLLKCREHGIVHVDGIWAASAVSAGIIPKL